MVDLISLFLRVNAPTTNLKTMKNSFNNPYTSTSPITGDQLSAYMWKPLTVGCAAMVIGSATAVYYVHTSRVWRFAKLEPRENKYFCFLFFGANPRNIVPCEIIDIYILW